MPAIPMWLPFISSSSFLMNLLMFMLCLYTTTSAAISTIVNFKRMPWALMKLNTGMVMVKPKVATRI